MNCLLVLPTTDILMAPFLLYFVVEEDDLETIQAVTDSDAELFINPAEPF